MPNRSLFLLLSLIAIAATAASAALGGDRKFVVVGEYEPIKNLKDPHVVEIAHFAVNQHNKQSGDRLQLVKIIKGEQQVVEGMNYRLVIEAKDGGIERNYQAIVYESLSGKFRKLTSFKPLIADAATAVSAALGGDRKVVVGAYEPIKNLKDPHVVEIAQFAVDQHNKQSGDRLQLVKIVKGEQQVVAGMNYRLVIEAKDGGVERNYQAIVYERSWAKIRKLTSFKPLIADAAADAATAASATLGGDRKRIAGGYEPIKNLTDPHVVEIAQFAVDQLNKQSGDRLQLVKIVKGEQQVVEGMNYRLVIEAKDGGVERNYQAIVYESLSGKFRKLTSFKPLIADAATAASAALGGDRKFVVVGEYEPIKNLKDPHVVEIAHFAVDQHNKQSDDRLQLVKIVKGEQQVVEGMNYRLVIEAKDGGVERNYQAIVYESLSGKFRKLTSFKPLIADAATAASAALGGDRKFVVVGEYEPIKNLKDPHVVEIAHFAVDQHNKQSDDRLQLVKIVKGEQQVVAGMNYRLVIEAKDGGVERNYQAIVYERSWAKIRKLTSFKPLIADAAVDAATAASAALGGDRKRIAGGYEPIKNLTDPHVVEIAQFAVDQLNKQSGDRLQLVKIVKGEQQVVAGINYRLVIKAKDGGAERNYEAIIYDRPWDKIRKLISFKQMLT